MQREDQARVPFKEGCWKESNIIRLAFEAHSV